VVARSLVAVACAAALVAAGCGSEDAGRGLPPFLPPASFYRLPAHVPTRPPGSILRVLRLRSPAAYRLWVVLYHSRSAAGRDVIVSGVLALPSRRPRRGGFPVVSFGHGTAGFTDAAAPSRTGRTGTPLSQDELFAQLIPRGYAVAVSDLEGLGTPGPAQYEVGASAAHAMLDAARAARRRSGGRIGRRVAVVGHSQGGHAALWAAQLARGYAPELSLRAVVASAPGANLPAILRRHAYTPETTLNVLRLLGAWHSIYGLRLEPLLNDAGRRAAALALADRESEIDPRTRPFGRPPASSAALMRLARRNTPGSAPASAPILMLIGGADRQVPPPTNLELVRHLREQGDDVRLRVLSRADHDHALVDSGAEILRFLRERTR
jgi:alpha-beta hydrolase superfamily lysophospholipase